MPDYGRTSRTSTYLVARSWRVELCDAGLAELAPPKTLANLDFFRFRQNEDERTSRQDRKYPCRKTGAAFWFWETDDDERTRLWHLIEIGEQLDLIVVCAQDVRFQ